jgi:hypothetical protein
MVLKSIYEPKGILVIASSALEALVGIVKPNHHDKQCVIALSRICKYP